MREVVGGASLPLHFGALTDPTESERNAQDLLELERARRISGIPFG
jgi:hypothetical protein